MPRPPSTLAPASTPTTFRLGVCPSHAGRGFVYLLARLLIVFQWCAVRYRVPFRAVGRSLPYRSGGRQPFFGTDLLDAPTIEIEK